MLIIGIDPGLTGGVAILPLYDLTDARIYPLAKTPLADLSLLFSDLKKGRIIKGEGADVEVFLEEPSLNPYLPGQACKCCKKRPMRNSQSFAKLGRSLGTMEGVCISHGWTPTFVFPTKWQNALGCRTGGDKAVSRRKAQALFPFLTRELKKGGERSTVTNDVADALLIAYYGYTLHTSLKGKKHVPRPTNLRTGPASGSGGRKRPSKLRRSK